MKDTTKESNPRIVVKAISDLLRLGIKRMDYKADLAFTWNDTDLHQLQQTYNLLKERQEMKCSLQLIQFTNL
jgi:hypothetical protein